MLEPLYTEQEREQASFYVADSRGVPIWNYLVVDGAKRSTLDSHEYSHVKYPSRFKFSLYVKVCQILCNKCYKCITLAKGSDTEDTDDEVNEVRDEGDTRLDGAERMEGTNNLFSVKSQPKYMGCSSHTKLYISIYTCKFSDGPEPQSTSDVPFIRKFVVVKKSSQVRPHLL